MKCTKVRRDVGALLRAHLIDGATESCHIIPSGSRSFYCGQGWLISICLNSVNNIWSKEWQFPKINNICYQAVLTSLPPITITTSVVRGVNHRSDLAAMIGPAVLRLLAWLFLKLGLCPPLSIYPEFFFSRPSSREDAFLAFTRLYML